MKSLARIRNRKGRCYELAYRVMLFEPGADKFSLVHGHLRTDSYAHAWIETGEGKVYDEYAQRFAAVADHRYSQKQTIRLGLATEVYGPWTEAEIATLL